MTRVVWFVMIALVLALGIPAAIMKSDEEKAKTFPQQEIARAVRVPTDATRRVIVPPCGTGVNLTTRRADALAKTPGAVSFVLPRGAAERDRIVLLPRCRASQGAAPSEGAQLPAAAFILPLEAEISAGRGGSIAAGAEFVESQLVIPPNSPIRNVIVSQCIEGKEQAQHTAVGRSIILDPEKGRKDSALAPPC